MWQSCYIMGQSYIPFHYSFGSALFKKTSSLNPKPYSLVHLFVGVGWGVFLGGGEESPS